MPITCHTLDSVGYRLAKSPHYSLSSWIRPFTNSFRNRTPSLITLMLTAVNEVNSNRSPLCWVLHHAMNPLWKLKLPTKLFPLFSPSASHSKQILGSPLEPHHHAHSLYREIKIWILKFEWACCIWYLQLANVQIRLRSIWLSATFTSGKGKALYCKRGS